jgi:hypothetical protein
VGKSKPHFPLQSAASPADHLSKAECGSAISSKRGNCAWIRDCGCAEATAQVGAVSLSMRLRVCNNATASDDQTAALGLPQESGGAAYSPAVDMARRGLP